jgi:hypothetical protein
VDYWRARLKLEDAVWCAQSCGLALAHTKANLETRDPIVESYREALRKNLLTRAPNMTAVKWKRHQLSRGFIKYHVNKGACRKGNRG